MFLTLCRITTSNKISNSTTLRTVPIKGSEAKSGMEGCIDYKDKELIRKAFKEEISKKGW
jgi:hypothetical protein